MSQLLRILGVAVLSVALLDASTGLCFCHRDSAVPGPAPESHSCCHGPTADGPTAVKAANYCCHIESADHQATPTVAVQFAPPVSRVAPVDAWSAAKATAVIARVLPTSSPPLLALRI